MMPMLKRAAMLCNIGDKRTMTTQSIPQLQAQPLPGEDARKTPATGAGAVLLEARNCIFTSHWCPETLNTNAEVSKTDLFKGRIWRNVENTRKHPV